MNCLLKNIVIFLNVLFSVYIVSEISYLLINTNKNIKKNIISSEYIENISISPVLKKYFNFDLYTKKNSKKIIYNSYIPLKISNNKETNSIIIGGNKTFLGKIYYNENLKLNEYFPNKNGLFLYFKIPNGFINKFNTNYFSVSIYDISVLSRNDKKMNKNKINNCNSYFSIYSSSKPYPSKEKYSKIAFFKGENKEYYNNKWFVPKEFILNIRKVQNKYFCINIKTDEKIINTIKLKIFPSDKNGNMLKEEYFNLISYSAAYDLLKDQKINLFSLNTKILKKDLTLKTIPSLSKIMHITYDNDIDAVYYKNNYVDSDIYKLKGNKKDIFIKYNGPEKFVFISVKTDKYINNAFSYIKAFSRF